MSGPAARLYLLSPGTLVPDPAGLDAFAARLGAALAAGDVACFQLRLKDASDDDIAAAVDRLAPIARAAGAAFVLNDRADLARDLDCDGVHVGRGDMSCREARAVVGPGRIVGASCGASRHLAMEAGEAGADYAAFGGFFPSPTKPGGRVQATPDLLADWRAVATLPSVAIGGITPENCGPLVRAGADFLCAASGVWDHAGGPAAGVAAFGAAIREAGGETPGGDG